MTDRLAGISAFVHAAEAGSFALAAERLHLTRSAVGKSIARLEERLGTRLFLRTTRRQTLTADGQAFYEHCVRALAELDAGEAALSASRISPQGRLHVSTPVLFGRRCVAPLLLELASRYPQLEVQISFTDRVVDLVDENIDLVVRSGTLRHPPADLVARKVGEQTMIVCASPGYLERHGTPRTVAELEGHHAVLYAAGRREVGWPLSDATASMRVVTMKHRLRFDDLETIVAAVKAGAGLARLPCWLVAEDLRAGALERVLAGTPAPTIDVHLAWRRTRHLPSRVRVAIDLLAARLPALLNSPG
ncbi:LysR family transcriptional regulator [Trinickia dabaoshanensis]|uniref:LysR family transcriptional regulator n=1 Tax=Trinickia dabaoshanensis TaxID=564714 RepID=A0A2N7VX37_9BURK|nr:LysR family transcriptional regulator [Trinickia dabaoshanensis]PMS21722.1 LysR family transcriptional regulator [Trinickia dabaoshanensis]